MNGIASYTMNDRRGVMVDPSRNSFLIQFAQMRLSFGSLLGVACIVMVLLAGCSDAQKTSPDSSNRRPPTVDADAMQAALMQASDAAEHGDFGRVESLLRPVLIANPEQPQALFLTANAQALRGDFAEAVKTLDSISSDDPEAELAALGQSADWLLELRKYDEAEERLRRIIGQNADAVLAHRRLAQLLNNQGRRIEALPHMRSLARLGDVTEPELYGMTTFSDPFVSTSPSPVHIDPSQLCRLKIDWYEGKQQEVCRQVASLCNQNPGSIAISAFCGRVYVQRRDDTAFAQWLSQLPAGIENEPEYWSAIGIWYQRQNQHDVAIRCFLEAVRRDDTDRYSYLGLARSLEAIGETTLAANVLNRFELLDEVANIATANQRSSIQLDRIVEILKQLRRFDEARCWLKLTGKSTPGRFAIDSANDHRIADLSSIDQPWLTCGIELEQWPLPSLRSSDVAVTESVPSRVTPNERIVLTNVAEQASLHTRYLPGPQGTDLNDLLMHQTVGGGIGVLDYDLDGWHDLYLAQGGGPAFDPSGSEANLLFRNLNAQAFQKVSSLAGVDDRGYAQGVAAADINQDGFTDLIVANIGPNVYYVNNGDGTFQRHRFSESFQTNLWTTSIACGDVTGDHLPEIVEVNYIDDPSVLRAQCSEPGGNGRCNPQRFRPAADHVLRNAGNGLFESWNVEAFEQSPGYGFALTIANIDDRFGNDVFVANDSDPNHLWLSQIDADSGGYSLFQRAQLFGCATGLLGNPQSCMGIAGGDFDRDGRMDLHITNYTEESSDLYLQSKSGIFENEFIRYGLEAATWSMVGWGTQTADFNGDGWLDLAIVNGHLYSRLTDGHPYRMPPQFFAGSEYGFHVVEPYSSDPFWSTPSLGRALAKLDWNNDGRVDLVAYDLDAPVALLENRTTTGNWLQLQLIGTISERDAIGAKLILQCGADRWTGWVAGGGGYLCANEPTLHFGIGEHQAVEQVTVIWPSGMTEQHHQLSPNRRYQLVEGQAVDDAR